MSDLSRAKSLATSVRFSGDIALRHHGLEFAQSERAHSFGLFNSDLEISQHVTPDLELSIQEACAGLSFPRAAVSAFVYSSPHIQASCLSSLDRCFVRFSSALVDLLDKEEFKFVVGHEIAHFLLDHQINAYSLDDSIESFIQRRAQEISADRIALIACGSINIANRTLMKTMSGLSERHLRFDVRTFVAQLDRDIPSTDDDSISSSHPSMIVRCRALLWFSAVKSDTSFRGAGSRQATLDDKIQSDLDRFVNGPARARIKDAMDEVMLWLAAMRIVEAGKYTRRAQDIVGNMFDPLSASGLKSFLSDSSPNEIEGIIAQKMYSARALLEKLIPISFVEEYKRLEEKVSVAFSAL